MKVLGDKHVVFSKSISSRLLKKILALAALQNSPIPKKLIFANPGMIIFPFFVITDKISFRPLINEIKGLTYSVWKGKDMIDFICYIYMFCFVF